MITLLLALALQDDSRVLVALEDGSSFTAKVTSEPIEIKTGYGDLRIPLQDVRSIRRASDGEHVVRTARLTIQGTLLRDEFSFDTDFGKLTIPAKDVKGLDWVKGASFFFDDTTVAFWTFEDGDGPRDFAGDRKLTMSEASVSEESSGARVFVRKSENSYVQGEFPSDFNFGDTAFTIEVRVKIGSVSRGYATLVARNEEGNTHNRDFWFLVQSGGQLYFDSGNASRTNFVSQTPVVVNLNAWSYIAAAYDPKAGEMRYYVNGKKVHTDRRAFSFNASSGPLFLGPGNSGKAYFSCPERFQFVRISKSARTDEEIAEWQKVLESEVSIAATRASGRGVSLRSGGTLRGELPTIVGAKFRTKYGTLEITAETKGRIELYPFREKEIEALRDKIAGLIESLGADSITEREDAQNELLKLGGPAIPLLQEAKGSDDPEIQTRVENILKKFEETGVLRRPVMDILRMGRTVLHGWLEVTEVELTSKYGSFKTPIGAIGVIALSEPEKGAAGPVIRLRSGEAVEGDPRESTIQLETDFGTLKVPLKDVITFKYDDAKKHWTVKTEKATLSGQVGADKILLQTQAGPIELPLSEMAEFGK